MLVFKITCATLNYFDNVLEDRRFTFSLLVWAFWRPIRVLVKSWNDRSLGRLVTLSRGNSTHLLAVSLVVDTRRHRCLFRIDGLFTIDKVFVEARFAIVVHDWTALISQRHSVVISLALDRDALFSSTTFCIKKLLSTLALRWWPDTCQGLANLQVSQ